MHRSSFLTMKKFRDDYLKSNDILKILDIGSFDSSKNSYNYRQFFNKKDWDYFGLDIQKGPNVDIVVSDIYNWKEINNESFDVVISGQAFEHMAFFWKAIKEVSRILKKGGYCCIIAPSSGPVHSNSLDCFRFRDDGMKMLGKYANLNVLEVYTNTDKNSYPWYDSVIIAKK